MPEAKSTNNMEPNERVEWDRILIILLLLALMTIVIFLTVKNSFISDQGLVIGFFGILATVVVLGNYSQSENIRRDTQREIDKVQDSIKTINKIQNDFYVEGHPKFDMSAEALNKKISDEIGKRMLAQVASYEENLDKLFDYCVGKDYESFIYVVVKKGQRLPCLVRVKGYNRDRKAWAKFIDNKIVFRDSDDFELQNVVRVDKKDYDEERMNRLAILWKETHKDVNRAGDVYNELFGSNIGKICT